MKVTGEARLEGLQRRQHLLEGEVDVGLDHRGGQVEEQGRRGQHAAVHLYDDGVFPTTLPGEGLFSWGGFWDAAGYHAGGQWAAHPGCIHVHGERGALRIFHYANALFLNDADGLRQIPVEDRPAPHHFAAQIEAFVEDIRADAAPATPAEAGVEALRVLLAAYESDGRRTVAIPG